MSSSLRAGLSAQRLFRFRNLTKQRMLHNNASSIRSNGCAMSIRPNEPRVYLHPTSMAAQSLSQVHAYMSSISRTSPTPDNLIEELQILYVIATDMLEIATDSTHKDTVNAASDLESARDALNQLATVYEVYTMGGKIIELSGGDGAPEAGQPSPGVKLTFDAESISDTVRVHIRNRFGQKVLSLRNAVRLVEEKAQM